MSVMDVVQKINDSNVILPSGDVKLGPNDYNIFENTQIDVIHQINDVPLKATADGRIVTVSDIGEAKDASAIQTNIVRIDGQPSIYLPILKQGGDSNTIEIVDGVRNAVAHLFDAPKSLIAKVVFDQSVFVKNALENLIHEGLTGLILTGLMILIFLSSPKATAGVFLSIPLSVLTTLIILNFGGSSINTMVLGGFALVFSRLIDNSVVVLENIFRHMEDGMSPRDAAEIGGSEVALPVLAATLTTAIVFFPVTLLHGVSQFLFTALGLAVVLSLFASYFVAMTVVPLFCARLIKLKPHTHAHGEAPGSLSERFGHWFNRGFEHLLVQYDTLVGRVLKRPAVSLSVLLIGCFAFGLLAPLVGLAYFPRTDPGQFVINLKGPTGTRVEVTSQYVSPHREHNSAYRYEE